ncbi:unnamed protein product [Trichobilharzia szidati]|nr:unnamed protein product [Trichobilharzia szidati]
MDWDLENYVQGIFITVIVCIVSSVLCYVFRKTLFASYVSATQDSENLVRKKKKGELKKSKKTKKVKILVDGQQGGEVDTDRTQTSDDTTAEEDEHLSDVPSDSRASSSSEESVERPTQALHTTENCLQTKTDDASYQIGQSCLKSSNSSSLNTETNRSQHDDSDSINSSCTENNITATVSPSIAKEPQPMVRSKKSKRRATKRSTGSGELPKEESSIDSVSSEQPVKPHEEAMKLECTISKKHESQRDFCATSELHAKIEQLQEQLKASENKLSETSRWANSLAEENKRFRSKEEETSLGLQVLQVQYTELLRANKTLEHQNNLLDRKLKNIESENCDLLKRLDQTNADARKVKADAELELCKMREQLTENEAQLTAMAAAMSVSQPSIPTTPLPELVRTQELAQAMSNDNCLLKSRIEQLDSELSQLRQSNMRQQQDLQVFRAENHKLHAEKEAALEELRSKRQTEQAENEAARMELNLRCRELELEKQKNQELSMSLSEVRAELSRSLQQEKRQTEIIGSLEYQFAELNAQKQRLLESANQSKIVNEAATSELRAQVANLSNDLMHVTSELNTAEQKVHELTCQLETVKKSLNDNKELNGESIIVNIKSEEVCVSKEENDKTEVYENLRNRLSEVESNLETAEKERVKIYNLYQTALSEIDYLKSKLLETEEVLAKLEGAAEEEESKWRQLLAESEEEQNRLRKQLSDSQAILENTSGELNKVEVKPTASTHNKEKKKKKSKAHKSAESPSNILPQSNNEKIAVNIQPAEVNVV